MVRNARFDVGQLFQFPGSNGPLGNIGHVEIPPGVVKKIGEFLGLLSIIHKFFKWEGRRGDCIRVGWKCCVLNASLSTPYEYFAYAKANHPRDKRNGTDAQKCAEPTVFAVFLKYKTSLRRIETTPRITYGKLTTSTLNFLLTSWSDCRKASI